MNKKKLLCLVIGLVLLVGAVAAGISAFPNPITRAKQAVVGVWTGVVYQNGKAYSAGNGVFSGSAFGVKAENGNAKIFATNCHVVTDGNGVISDYIYILADGASILDESSVIPCRVLYSDAKVDVAIIEAVHSVPGVSVLPLRKVSDKLAGDRVYALGFPGIEDDFADEGENDYTMKHITVTDGIISRLLTHDGVECMSHTANINHGNSGGPLVDTYGQVVGINTMGTEGMFLQDSQTADRRMYAIYSDYVADAMESMGISYKKGSAMPYLPMLGLAVILALAGIASLVCSVKLPAGPNTDGGKPMDEKTAPKIMVCAVSGPLAGMSWLLRETLKIGRSTGLDVVLPEQTKGVSRIHCVFQCQGNSVTVTDLQSTYGTFINDTRVTPNQPAAVRPGDTVSLGSKNVQFTVRFE